MSWHWPYDDVDQPQDSRAAHPPESGSDIKEMMDLVSDMVTEMTFRQQELYTELERYRQESTRLMNIMEMDRQMIKGELARFRMETHFTNAREKKQAVVQLARTLEKQTKKKPSQYKKCPERPS